MNKSLILNEIKSYLNIKSDTEFSNFLGIKPQVLSNWKARNTFDIELIYTKCEIIDANWLLTGQGEMLKNPEVAEPSSQPQENGKKYTEALEKINALQDEIIRLMQENKRLAEENQVFQADVQDRATG